MKLTQHATAPELRRTRSLYLLKTLKCYDLRRGAAYEVATKAYDSQIGGYAAALLGHSKASVAAGVTKRYIDNLGKDNWSERVRDSEVNERPSQQVKLNANPGKRASIAVKAPQITSKAIEKHNSEDVDDNWTEYEATDDEDTVVKPGDSTSNKPFVAKPLFPPINKPGSSTSSKLAGRAATRYVMNFTSKTGAPPSGQV
ncbi:hypothetical protein F53441_679 [Fusarium austroafricanum]|uniref:Uncharacterized protein n=1 Tax=Fusarium austroafricanum TaxID=2364996 RepID=A0A8H4P334_9HYPO|nr:hypothetical protein F53441_679 [Fusarium austroafricanum]